MANGMINVLKRFTSTKSLSPGWATPKMYIPVRHWQIHPCWTK